MKKKTHGGRRRGAGAPVENQNARKEQKSNKRLVSARVSPEIYQRLELRSKERGVAVSRVISDFLATFPGHHPFAINLPGTTDPTQE